MKRTFVKRQIYEEFDRSIKMAKKYHLEFSQIQHNWFTHPSNLLGFGGRIVNYGDLLTKDKQGQTIVTTPQELKQQGYKEEK